MKNYRSIIFRIMVMSILSTAPVFAADAEDDAPGTVLITGANRGIGFEFVQQYAGLGWNVIATCRNPDGSDELNLLADTNKNITVERLDLLDHAGIDALAAQYANQPIDILINNAGLMRGPEKGQLIGSIDYDEFILFYRINVMGPLKVSEAFYPNVKKSDLRVMAALTTGKGDKGIPVPGFSLYKTSKAALDSVQKEMAIRWQRQGIKVVTLLPGRVLTHGEKPNPAMPDIPIDKSINGMIDVMATLQMEQSGQTIQWDGELIE